jgi:hypothetical protein
MPFGTLIPNELRDFASCMPHRSTGRSLFLETPTYDDLKEPGVGRLQYAASKHVPLTNQMYLTSFN